MRFNHKKFFDGFRPFYKAATGLPLEQDKVEAVEFLLSQFESNSQWTLPQEVAYAFATMHIETFWPKSGKRYEPIVEGGGPAYFKKYDGRSDLGNTEKGDGARFKGRGYVQITGRKNYTKFTNLLGIDLVNNPDLALDPGTAFQIMTIGMFKGIFTGKKLGTFVNATRKDYFDARTVINGHDRAGEIAGYAVKFEQILTDALDDGTTDLQGESSVKVKVDGAKVEVEQTSSAATENAKIAVVASKPPSFVTRLWAKVTGAIMGNGAFQWLMSQLDNFKNLSVPERVWEVVTILAVLGTVIWLISEAVKGYQLRKRQKEMEALLIQANSTPTNRAQVIHPDDVPFFVAKGYKIVNTGDKLPESVTNQPTPEVVNQ